MQVVRPERDAPLSLAFEVVPAYDAILGLAAVAQPEKHELPSGWARKVRQALPVGIRADITFFFGDPLVLGTGAIGLIPDLQDGTPAGLLSALTDADTAGVLSLLLARGMWNRQMVGSLKRFIRNRPTAEDAKLVEAHMRAMRAETRRRATAMLADPDGTRSRYVALIDAFHRHWLSDQLPQIEPILTQRARHGRRSIGKIPAREVIARATGGFTLRAQGARSVTLVPSYFATPFVYALREGREPVLVFGARPPESPGKNEPVDAQSVRVLKALADETRLRILQLLAAQPMYGQQLADALGVSHPTVSHHMAQLRIAGLTRTELDAEGNKTYFVRSEALEDLFSDLRLAFMPTGPREEVV
jgi:DNA-binding transcriptional ArsR family regulator